MKKTAAVCDKHGFSETIRIGSIVSSLHCKKCVEELREALNDLVGLPVVVRVPIYGDLRLVKDEE